MQSRLNVVEAIYREKCKKAWKKGQVSFEFVIVLAIVILLSSVIMFDIVDESTDMAVLSSAKSTAANYASLNVMTRSECIDSYLSRMKFYDSTIELEFGGPVECKPTAIEIADIVESTTCSAQPNNDDQVRCSGNIYIIKII